MKCPACNVEEIHCGAGADGACPICGKDVIELCRLERDRQKTVRAPMKRDWLVLILSFALVVSTVLATLFAAMYFQERGESKALREMLKDCTDDLLERERQV